MSLTHKLTAGFIALLMSFGLLVAFQPTAVDAQNINAACEGVNLTGQDVGCSENDGGAAQTSLGNVIAAVINILSIIVGAASVIMIVLGGLNYITSSGDAGKITSARNTIIYAIVGLIIVIFAQVIVNFVITRSAGTGAAGGDGDGDGGENGYIQIEQNIA